jgi:hypothetical protein
MPDAIPHPSHRSAEFWSARGLDQLRPHRGGSTLSVDVRKPFRGCRTSVASTLPPCSGSLVVDPAKLSGLGADLSAWAGISNVGRKGCLQVSAHEPDRTGAFPQPASARFLLERVCGIRLRLAAPPVRPTWIPRRQARPISTIGGRPLDRRSDRDDFSGQSMSLPYTGGTV